MNRLLVELAVAVALVAAIFATYRQAYEAGLESGRAGVLADWHADTARQETARLEALARSQRAAQEVERGLSEKLAAATARGDDLADRLREHIAAQARAGLRAGGPACPADGAGRIPSDEAAVGAALAGHLAACDRDAERLTRLQDYVRTVVH